ncbi:hypothetical protein ABT095_31530 [Kitasatospora sp. NPDC002227]|uniref:hypothetical protein n=1 Tax=Kitasatospora sp. NPDC002227 TaxID=3154773 RepID=UPI00332F5479
MIPSTTPVKPRLTWLKVIGAFLLPPLGFLFLWRSPRAKGVKTYAAVVLGLYSVLWLVAVFSPKPAAPTAAPVAATASPSTSVAPAPAVVTVSPSPSATADPAAAAADGKAWGEAYARLLRPAAGAEPGQNACQGAAGQGVAALTGGTLMPHVDLHGSPAAWVSACVTAELAAEQALAPTPSPSPTPPPAPAPAPTVADRPSSAPVHTEAPPQPEPTTHQAAGCTTDSKGNCIVRGRYCPNSAHGGTGTDAAGRVLTCEDKNGWRWE